MRQVYEMSNTTKRALTTRHYSRDGVTPFCGAGKPGGMSPTVTDSVMSCNCKRCENKLASELGEVG